MLGKKWIQKFFAVVTAIAVWNVYSMTAFAAPNTKDINGELTVTGSVTVNGQAAVSNTTIVSGSSIETSANSTATISLGKFGRIEVNPGSSLKLNFSSTTITGVLSAGKVKVANPSGVAATITTGNATVVADTAQNNTFVVEVECSHTHVDTIAGLVTMRTGTTDKQVAAGSEATAGNVVSQQCPPCYRQGGTPVPLAVGGISRGALAALIIGALGGIGAAVFLGSRENNPQLGGSVTDVSPSR